MKKTAIVDVHSHFFTPEYLQAVKEAGFLSNRCTFYQMAIRCRNGQKKVT
jgi:hypothetical protein